MPRSRALLSVDSGLPAELLDVVLAAGSATEPPTTVRDVLHAAAAEAVARTVADLAPLLAEVPA